jgi:hypothetical protein
MVGRLTTRLIVKSMLILVIEREPLALPENVRQRKQRRARRERRIRNPRSAGRNQSTMRAVRAVDLTMALVLIRTLVIVPEMMGMIPVQSVDVNPKNVRKVSE